MSETEPEAAVERMLEEAAPPRQTTPPAPDLPALSHVASATLALIHRSIGGEYVDADAPFERVTRGVRSEKETLYEHSRERPFELLYEEERCTVQAITPPLPQGGAAIITFDAEPLLRRAATVELRSARDGGDAPPWGAFLVPHLSGPCLNLKELRLHGVGVTAALVDQLSGDACLTSLYVNGLLLDSCRLADLPALRTLHLTLTRATPGAQFVVAKTPRLRDVLVNTARRVITTDPRGPANDVEWNVHAAQTGLECVSFQGVDDVRLHCLHLAFNQIDMLRFLTSAKPGEALGFRAVAQLSLSVALRELEPELYVPRYGDAFFSRAGPWELSRATLRTLGKVAGNLTLARLLQSKFTATTLANDNDLEDLAARLTAWRVRQLVLSDEAAIVLRVARPAWPLLTPHRESLLAGDMLAAPDYAYATRSPAALLAHVSVVAVAHTDLVEPEAGWWARPAVAKVYRTRLATARAATRDNVTPVPPHQKTSAPEPIFTCNGLVCVVDQARWALFRATVRQPHEVDLVVFVDAAAFALLPPEATHAPTAKAMLAGSDNAARFAVQVWPERDTASTGMLSGLVGGLLGSPPYHASTNAVANVAVDVLGNPRFETPAE